MKYVALLRGINVTGHHIIKMEDLRKYFESFQLKNVQTYIQSGNVVFDSSENNANTLTKKIESGLKKNLGYDVSVMLRTKTEMENVIENFPFKKLSEEKEKRVYIVFLSEEPVEEKKQVLLSCPSDVESYEMIGREVFILCEDKGYGKTKFNNGFIEKKLSLSATTRNWNTVNKILEMM